ncbi:YCF48-related protein [Caballeronia sp. SBC2]|uniref:YCF48-related protein n=1 Tax=Caballeronia sp. SBC2 TaxID=2705547 RepID=UPI0013E1E6C0|nr:Ycf48-like protein [Caballeronia sp. SBC2]
MLPKDDDGKGGAGFGDIAVADNKKVWVVGCQQQKLLPVEGGSRLDFTYAGVMHSSDGGVSWENVRLSVPLEGRCIRAVQFVGQNGWIVSAAGIVVNTIDGGKTCSFQADTLMDARRMQLMRVMDGFWTPTSFRRCRLGGRPTVEQRGRPLRYRIQSGIWAPVRFLTSCVRTQSVFRRC